MEKEKQNTLTQMVETSASTAEARVACRDGALAAGTMNSRLSARAFIVCARATISAGFWRLLSRANCLCITRLSPRRVAVTSLLVTAYF